jgi:hypothetical protein|uniref:Uncharacterized protein n=1 Tax=Caudovirales sp. ct0YK8 TaxID=2826764 RepID=A0A8S5NQW8_9CAUD|nr:MAG TPA: hypothetical protein [Caudovirales sp. ct0YK8]
MTDREKKELIEAEETILQLFFDAYERAMKYTKGNINLSLRMAAMLDGSRPDGKQVLSIFVANGEG